MDEDDVKSANLLSNDDDPDSDGLSVSPIPIIVPENGDVIINANGLYYYMPDQHYNGVDSFTYEICDSGFPSLCDTAWVRIDIISVNDAPFAEDDVIYNDGILPSSINIDYTK